MATSERGCPWMTKEDGSQGFGITENDKGVTMIKLYKSSLSFSGIVRLLHRLWVRTWGIPAGRNFRGIWNYTILQLQAGFVRRGP